MILKRISITFFIASIFMMLLLIGFAKSNQNSAYTTYRSGDFFLPPYESENDRMGVGRSSTHDMTPLKAGWYLNWRSMAAPVHDGGMEYMQTIYFNVNGVGYCQAANKTSQIKPTITGTDLINLIQNHPGTIWQIGNEPDSYYNGSPLMPELYAEMYHYFYTTIKELDPLAKFATAGIVQPSLLRMGYLDTVLTHYEETYGEPMHVDVWSIHLYLLNEGPCGSSWGAAVPPGTSDRGWDIDFVASDILRLTSEDDEPSIESSLHDFRQWMYDNGYGDVPLIITEYGILPPPSYAGFENDVAAQFLHDTFNIFLSMTDDEIGLQTDNGRLVQMWSWFSTDHDPPAGYFKYGGDLFNKNGSLTVVGEAFVAKSSINITPYMDLQVAPYEGGFSATVDSMVIDGYITNQGNMTTTETIGRITLTNHNSSTSQLLDTFHIPSLPPRYQGNPVYISHTLTIMPNFNYYTITIHADPENVLTEINRSNNTLHYVFHTHFDMILDNMLVTPTVNSAAVEATIVNQGNSVSPETIAQLTFTDHFSHAVQIVDTFNIPALSPYQNMPFHIKKSWAFESPSPYYTLTIAIDPEHALAETNRANNQLRHVFKHFSDLAVIDLAVSPATYTGTGSLGALVTHVATTTIMNTGTHDSIEAPMLINITQFDDDGQALPCLTSTVIIPPLNPNETYQQVIPFSVVKSGIYEVMVTINPENLPSIDLNKDNNQKHVDIFVSPESIFISINPIEGGILTSAHNATTTIEVQPQVMTGSIILVYEPITVTESISPLVHFTDHAFKLSLYQNHQRLPDDELPCTILITIDYHNVNLEKFSDDTPDLRLYYQMDNGWDEAYLTCQPFYPVRHDEENRVLTTRICRLGKFVLSQIIPETNDSHKIYVPFILTKI